MFKFYVWRAWRDIKFGLHSNIPFCCVMFYVAIWSPLFDYGTGCGVAVVDRYRDWMDDNINAHYITCPICVLVGRVKPLHFCRKSNPKCRGYKPSLRA